MGYLSVMCRRPCPFLKYRGGSGCRLMLICFSRSAGLRVSLSFVSSSFSVPRPIRIPPGAEKGRARADPGAAP